MGHQIHAGESGIFFTDGAWLVANWCDRFAPPVKPKGMSDYEWFDTMSGGTHITADAVKATDSIVPMSFAEAKEGGFLDGDYRSKIDERCFAECRAFLKYASDGKFEITGSY